jgi:hypothetical protein
MRVPSGGLLVSLGAAVAVAVSACQTPPPAVATPRPQPADQSASAPDATLIVPGASIGALKLGMSDAQVQALLGPPRGNLKYKHAAVWTYLSPTCVTTYKGNPVTQSGFTSICDTTSILFYDHRAVQLEASAPFLHTADGTLTASKSTQELLTALGKPTSTTFLFVNSDSSLSTPAAKHIVTLADDAADGIAVKYGVWGSLGPEPDVSEPPEALVVHPRGHQAIANLQDGLPYAGHSARSWTYPRPKLPTVE